MSTEIEMRARFDEAKHIALATYLAKYGQDQGQDDKDIYFYVLPEQLVKVVHNVSRSNAKLVLKRERIGCGTAFPETEVAIAPEDVTNAVAFLDGLGLGRARHFAHNQRHNYRINDIDVALKWSEAWGYHAELEVLLDEEEPYPDDIQDAESRIRAVAGELGIELMSEKELLAFTRQFEKGNQP